MTARDGTMPGQLSCELTFSDLLFVLLLFFVYLLENINICGKKPELIYYDI